MGLAELPRDYIVAIVSWSTKGEPFLKHASLICRTWREPAQELLFRNIKLDSQVALDSFSQAVASGATQMGSPSRVSLAGCTDVTEFLGLDISIDKLVVRFLRGKSIKPASTVVVRTRLLEITNGSLALCASLALSIIGLKGLTIRSPSELGCPGALEAVLAKPQASSLSNLSSISLFGPFVGAPAECPAFFCGTSSLRRLDVRLQLPGTERLTALKVLQATSRNSHLEHLRIEQRESSARRPPPFLEPDISFPGLAKLEIALGPAMDSLTWLKSMKVETQLKELKIRLGDARLGDCETDDESLAEHQRSTGYWSKGGAPVMRLRRLFAVNAAFQPLSSGPKRIVVEYPGRVLDPRRFANVLQYEDTGDIMCISREWRIQEELQLKDRWAKRTTFVQVK